MLVAGGRRVVAVLVVADNASDEDRCILGVWGQEQGLAGRDQIGARSAKTSLIEAQTLGLRRSGREIGGSGVLSFRHCLGKLAETHAV
jgi:hypothetical protein